MNASSATTIEPWIQSQLHDFRYDELVPFIHHNFHWYYLHSDFRNRECEALDGWAHQSDDLSCWDALVTQQFQQSTESQDTTFQKKEYEYQWLTLPILRSYQRSLSTPILWKKRKAPRIESPWIFSLLKAQAYNQRCLRSAWQDWNQQTIVHPEDLIYKIMDSEERPLKRQRCAIKSQPPLPFSMDRTLSYFTWIREIWLWMMRPPLAVSSTSSAAYTCLNPSCEQSVNGPNSYCLSCWTLRELAHQIAFPKLRSCKLGNQSSQGNKDV